MSRATWIFAGLFLAFGIPLIWLPKPSPAVYLFAGLSTISLGGFGIALAFDAARSGQLRLQGSTLRRSAAPKIFPLAVYGIGSCGVAVVGTGVWFLFDNLFS